MFKNVKVDVCLRCMFTVRAKNISNDIKFALRILRDIKRVNFSIVFRPTNNVICNF